MKGDNKILIGTSGWHYPHWRGNFYPESLSPAEWLSHYSQLFRTVEINNSFYQLPAEETFRQWHATVPPGFVFAVKASRYITHMKKLTDPVNSSAKFFERARLLQDKLGVILFQLPPHFRTNPERLESFLAALPDGHRYAFEFRDPSWEGELIYEILDRYNAALCFYDFNRRTSPLQVTANFVYLRLHGPGGPYQGSYSLEALEDWAREIQGWADQGRDVYCYFDNDMAGYAPQNARLLKQILAGG